MGITLSTAHDETARRVTTTTAAFLEPRPDGPAEQWAERSGAAHPVRAIAASYVLSWAVLAAAFTSLGLLLTKVVLEGARGRWDESINRWLADHRVPWLDHVTSAATFIANTLPVIVLLVLVGGVLLLRHRWREALFLLGALTLELTVFLTANTLVHRARPDVPRMDSTPSTGSYPSGHLAATLVFWCGTALIVNATVRNRFVRIVTWVVAVVVTLTVGFARTYRGMHHLTDVVCGAALGVCAIAASVFAVRVVSAVIERRRAEAPVPPPAQVKARALGVRP
jgi:membrane-associated phospholipid phosphatase